MFESSSDRAKYYPPIIIEKIRTPIFPLIINIFKFWFLDPNYKNFITLSTILLRKNFFISSAMTKQWNKNIFACSKNLQRRATGLQSPIIYNI